MLPDLPQAQHDRSSRSRGAILGSNPGLVLSFSALLILFALLATISLVRLQELQLQLEAIADQHMERIESVALMRRAAVEQLASLQTMLLTEDPARRESEWLKARASAAEFTRARQRLLSLGPGEEERTLLSTQARLSEAATPLQERVMDLILAGRDLEARRLLLDEAIPAQERVLAELERLQTLQDTTAHAAADLATDHYAATRLWTIGLAGAAITLGLAIAWLVILRTRGAERVLADEKERALVTLYSIGEGVITTDALGRVEHMNAAAERLIGRPLGEARGYPLLRLAQILHEQTRHPATDLLLRALGGSEVVRSTDELVLVTSHAGERAIELTSAPIRDAHRQLIGAVHVLRDVTEIRALDRELVYHATHDALTGLINRREFERRLQLTLDLARQDASEHALCYVDLDQFKVVNDTCGHAAGDELLRQLAQLLRSHARPNDTLARLGGDEFGILLDGCPIGFAEHVAGDIRRAIADFRFVWDGMTFDVGASIGVVPINADCDNVYEALRAADFACYAAKDEGRNRIHVFRADDASMVHREGEMHWVHRVKHALETNQFTLYHQVIEPLDPADVRGTVHEILLRMRGGNGEIVTPTSFLPVAERFQLGPAIDRWVVERTLAILGAVPKTDETFGYQFNINLSGQSLGDPGLLDFIVERMEATGTDGRRLCFEITETAAIGHLNRAQEFIHTLKARGCRFALDDFGSGLSSFGYLKNLPVDFLKIDGTFIRDILTDPTDFALVESINQIGHVMGVKTIAEYVEDERIRALLTRIGVDYVQGYGVARPAPLSELIPHAAEIEETLNQRSA